MPISAKKVNTVLHAQSGERPAFLRMSTNNVAAYINELEPIKNTVLMP